MKSVNKTFDRVLKLSIVGLVLCSAFMGRGLSRLHAKNQDLSSSIEEQQTAVEHQTEALQEFEANLGFAAY